MGCFNQRSIPLNFLLIVAKRPTFLLAEAIQYRKSKYEKYKIPHDESLIGIFIASWARTDDFGNMLFIVNKRYWSKSLVNMDSEIRNSIGLKSWG